MIESEIDALVDALKLSEVDRDKLADSLGVIETEVAALPTTESLLAAELLEAAEALVLAESPAEAESLGDADVDADSLVAADVPDSLAVAEAADPLAAAGAADSDAEAGAADSDAEAGAADSDAEAGAADSDAEAGAADSDAEAGAADSVVLCDADSDVDSVAEALVAPLPPGVRAALLSVARVCRLVAVTSYETGVLSDMIYCPSSPRAVTDRIGEITVDLQATLVLISNDGRASGERPCRFGSVADRVSPVAKIASVCQPCGVWPNRRTMRQWFVSSIRSNSIWSSSASAMGSPRPLSASSPGMSLPCSGVNV